MTAVIRAMSIAGILAFLGAGLPLSSWAQTETERTHIAEKRPGARDMRISKLIGKEVQDPEGRKLGEIQDLIVDVAAQRVHYAVLSFEGEREAGEKLFAYPVTAFKLDMEADASGADASGADASGAGAQKDTGSDDESRALVLNIDRDRLMKAPGFERSRWPDWSIDRYRTEVDRYFKGNAVGGPISGERMLRASALVGKGVDDRRGRNAGEIEDLVVNLGSERIRYVVLDFDKAWHPDDKLVALPMNAFTFPARNDKDLVLNIERGRINTARGFDEDQWPDLNAPAYRRDIDAYLSRFQSEQQARPQQQMPGREATTSGASN